MNARLALPALLLVAACGGRDAGDGQAVYAGKSVEAWRAALEHGPDRQRTEAELRAAGADAIAVLAGLLGGPEGPARLLAAELCGRIGPAAAAAVPALGRALASRDWRLRVMAALAIGRIGKADGPALVALEAALGDRHAEVRVAAALAVWGIARDTETARGVLLEAMWSPDDRVRAMAVEAFGQLGAAAVDPLVLALADGSDRVRAAAAMALGHVGAPAREALPVLREYAGAEPDNALRRAAREAVAAIEAAATRGQ